MRPYFLGTICALALAGAVPAMAQSNPNANSNSGSNSGSSSPQKNASSSSSDTGNMSNMQQTLKQDLEKAGFKNVMISPGSFDVHATNASGQKVYMSISPDNVTEIVAAPQASSDGKPTASK